MAELDWMMYGKTWIYFSLETLAPKLVVFDLLVSIMIIFLVLLPLLQFQFISCEDNGKDREAKMNGLVKGRNPFWSMHFNQSLLFMKFQKCQKCSPLH